MSSLLKQVEAALVRFQGILAKASMNQQEAVDRLAQKTAKTYDKIWWNTAIGGCVRGGFKTGGTLLKLSGSIEKSSGLNNLPTGISAETRNVLVKQIEANAEKTLMAGATSDAVADFADTYFQAQRTGQEKVKELTQTEMSQQAAARSAMTNVEQYANTLEQRFDSHKQSARQI